MHLSAAVVVVRSARPLTNWSRWSFDLRDQSGIVFA
jgi:hypothetical protein